jgi:hypothetical protein
MPMTYAVPHHLAEDVLVLFGLRRDGDGERLIAALHGERYRPAAAGADGSRELVPGRDRLAVDRRDDVTHLEARARGGHARHHAADLGEVARHALAVDGRHDREGKECEQQVEQRARHHDGNPLPDRLMREGDARIDRFRRVGVLTHHLDEAAQRNGADDVLGAVDGAAEQLGAKPTENFSTPTPERLATMKWPNSCTIMRIPSTTMAARIPMITVDLRRARYRAR